MYNNNRGENFLSNMCYLERRNLMKAVFLSSKGYADEAQNHGDSVLIDTGKELVIFDCGCEEHARRVINYMNGHNYQKASFILSHNDSDHFDGLPFLLNEGKISVVYTTLLLKHVDELLKIINDKRRNRETLKKQILEKYSNIAKLSGAPLKDIYADFYYLPEGVNIVGPSKQYMLKTAAKWLDSRESDQQNGETAVNAPSIEVSVQVRDSRLLLCGDSAFAPLEAILKDYTYIQLPHHGKPDLANKIFDSTNAVQTTYIVSDNTGNSNGGSDDLKTRGRRVKNTKHGDVTISNETTGRYITAPLSGACLGDW